MSTFRCPRCNNEVPAQARFCNKCGFTPSGVAGPPASGQTASPNAIKPITPGAGPSLPPLQQRQGAGKPPMGGPSASQGGAPAQSPLPPARQNDAGLPPLRHTPAMADNQAASLPAGDIQPVRTSTPPPTQMRSGQPAGQAPTLPPGTPRNANALPATPAPTGLPPVTPITSMPQISRMPPVAMPPAAQQGTPSLAAGIGPESFFATSQAAEHWRSSWLERQRAEAGPAYGVTRGQASVDEPLQAMQNSFIRMRALAPLKDSEKQKSKMSFGFWTTIIMMICLIGGLSAYVIYTYLPGAPLQTQINVAPATPAPMLTLVGNAVPSIAAGKSLKVHGSYFGANDAITFILNTPLTDSNGKPLSVQSSSKGDFTANITIPTSTPAGAYALEAQDNQTGQHAFLDIQVLSPTAQSTTDSVKATTADGTSTLKFTASPGKGNPQSQAITLKNVSVNQVQWTVGTVTANGINWLLIENDTTVGVLNADGTATIEIGVLTTNLQNGTYTGQVVFTIQGQGQVIVPVTLSIGDTAAQLVIVPNPVLASWQAGGTCQPTSLTLLDMSNVPISWQVKEDADTVTSQHISLNGKTSLAGKLDPNGPAGNTAILQIICYGVNLNDVYHVTVYYNNTSQVIPIIIGS